MAETSHDGTSGSPKGRIIWRVVTTLIVVLLIQLLAFAVPRVVRWIEAVGLVAAIQYTAALLLVCGFLFMVFCGWTLLRALAPKLTKYATTILFMLFVLFALLPGWLLQTREQARREGLKRNLMRMGFKIKDTEQRTGRSLSPEEIQSMLSDPKFAPPGAGN